MPRTHIQSTATTAAMPHGQQLIQQLPRIALCYTVNSYHNYPTYTVPAGAAIACHTLIQQHLLQHLPRIAHCYTVNIYHNYPTFTAPASSTAAMPHTHSFNSSYYNYVPTHCYTAAASAAMPHRQQLLQLPRTLLHSQHLQQLPRPTRTASASSSAATQSTAITVHTLLHSQQQHIHTLRIQHNTHYYAMDCIVNKGIVICDIYAY